MQEKRKKEAPFGKIRHIMSDTSLNPKIKIDIYTCKGLVVSMLLYESEIWQTCALTRPIQGSHIVTCPEQPPAHNDHFDI